VYTTPETQINQVNKIYDVQAHLIDAIRQINTSHLSEQIVSNH
jgi:hypothetical protein